MLADTLFAALCASRFQYTPIPPITTAAPATLASTMIVVVEREPGVTITMSRGAFGTIGVPSAGTAGGGGLGGALGGALGGGAAGVSPGCARATRGATTSARVTMLARLRLLMTRTFARARALVNDRREMRYNRPPGVASCPKISRL